MNKKVGRLIAPELPDGIPNYSQWLSGQGAGTWFSIDSTESKSKYRIRRFSPQGELECDRIFEIEKLGVDFDINLPYRFVHISHCAICRIEQDNVIFTFNYINE